MRAYKLIRKRKDGTYGPLFINRRQRIPIGVWLEAEDHPTKGYARRPGWHTLAQPIAPHLKMMEGRVWVEVEIENYTANRRPECQGGIWFLANKMKVLREL